MAGGLGGLVVGSGILKIIPDLSQVPAKVSEAAGQASSAFESKMATVGKIGGNMTKFVTLPILAAGAASFKVASDIGESLSKVDKVFEGSAGVVTKFAESSTKAFGVSKANALEAAGTFGNLFRAIGLGSPVAADMSVKMVGLAGDLASFNNADPTEVLDALRSGLVGETEPLRKFGVSINEARIQAEAMSLGLVKPVQNMAKITDAQLKHEKATKSLAEATKKHGAESLEAREAQNALDLATQGVEKALAGEKVELNAAQKAQAAYSIILKDTKLAQGDYADTADSAANRMKNFKNQASDLAGAFGSFLLPIGTKVLGMISGMVDFFGALPAPVLKVIGTIAGVVAVVGPLLLVFSKLVSIFKAVQAAWFTFQIVFLANPFVLLIAAVIGLVILIVANWEHIVAFSKAIWEGLSAFFGAIWSGIKAVFSAALSFIGGLLSGAWNGISGVARAVWNGIASFFSGLWNGIRALFSGAMSAIGGAISNSFNFWRSIIVAVWNGISSFLSGIWAGIRGAASAVWNAITGVISGAINGARGTITSIWSGISGFLSGLWSGIRGTASAVWNGISGAITGAIDAARAGVSRAVNAIIGFFSNLWERAQFYVRKVTDAIRSLPFVPGSPIPMVVWTAMAERGMGEQFSRMTKRTLASVGAMKGALQGLSKGPILPSQALGAIRAAGDRVSGALAETHKHYHLSAVGSPVTIDEERLMELLRRMEALSV